MARGSRYLYLLVVFFIFMLFEGSIGQLCWQLYEQKLYSLSYIPSSHIRRGALWAHGNKSSVGRRGAALFFFHIFDSLDLGGAKGVTLIPPGCLFL